MSHLRRKLRARIDELTREKTNADTQAIDAERRELHRKILSWFDLLPHHMPKVAEIVSASEDEMDCDLDSENLCLHMPSDFLPAEQEQLDICSIAATELQLRKGEANDAIQRLRIQINYRLGLIEQSKDAQYTKGRTRAAKLLQDARRAVDAAADEYRSARKAIIALGGDGKKEYQELTSEDLNAKTISGGRPKDHSGKEMDSWIYCRVVALAGSAENETEWERDSESVGCVVHT